MAKCVCGKNLIKDKKYKYSNFHGRAVCNECYQWQYSYARNKWEHGRGGKKYGKGSQNVIDKKIEKIKEVNNGEV
jgi:hypothetical protein